MPTRPPEPRRYYLDANLDGPDLVERLRAGGLPCEPHRDHFPADAEDEAWIPAIAARGWVIVTRDFAIQRRPAERHAWTAAQATVVMLRGDRLSAEKMCHPLQARRRAEFSRASVPEAQPRSLDRLEDTGDPGRIVGHDATGSRQRHG